MPKTLISILNWNNSRATNNCLEGLTSLDNEENFDVLLIDNASGEKLMLDGKTKGKLGKRLRVKYNQQNLGFSGGHNQSAQIAFAEKYDYLILLNNDTEIIDKGIFAKLVAALDSDGSAGLAAPTILSNVSPEKVWYGGGVYSRALATVRHSNNTRIDNSSTTIPVTFATGCCMAVKLSTLKQLDRLFYDDYFLYWEDADLSARMLEINYKILYVSQASILHKVSSSLGAGSGTYAYYNIRNKFIFMRKNTMPTMWPLAFLHSSYVFLKYVLLTILKSPNKRTRLSMVFKGYYHGVTGKRGALS